MIETFQRLARLALACAVVVATPASAAVLAFQPYFQNLSFFNNPAINSGVIGYSYADGGKAFVNSFDVAAASGDNSTTITDPFKKESPITQIFFAGVIDREDGAHLVLGVNDDFAGNLEGDPYEDDFSSVAEADLINALRVLSGRAEGSIDASADLVFTFSDEIYGFTGLQRAGGFAPVGSFTLISYSQGSLAGTGQAFVTLAPQVPEPATWALLIAGFGLAGAAARRRACMTYA